MCVGPGGPTPPTLACCSRIGNYFLRRELRSCACPAVSPRKDDKAIDDGLMPATPYRETEQVPTCEGYAVSAPTFMNWAVSPKLIFPVTHNVMISMDTG